jgi:hypothetical protein
MADLPPPRAKLADFSPRAVARAVLGESLQKPYVLYPTAVGVLGGLAAVLLGPSLLFVAPAAVGAAVGVGSWMLNYTLRRDQNAAEYLGRLQASLAGQTEETIARLRSELQEQGFEPGLSQMTELQAKFRAFDALLRRKLNPAEMTFGRYRGMTEQVFLAALDNLSRISDTLKGLSAIDVSHATRRLQELADDGVESKAQDREIATLKERLGLRDSQRAQVDQWLAENETAMTQIDHVMAAIAGLDTEAGHATMTMESAMEELKSLAQRASALSVDR